MTNIGYKFFKELYFEEARRREGLITSIRLHYTAIAGVLVLNFFLFTHFQAKGSALYIAFPVFLILSTVLLLIAIIHLLGVAHGDAQGTRQANEIYKYHQDLIAYDTINRSRLSYDLLINYLTESCALAADAIMKDHDRRIANRREAQIEVAKALIFSFFATILFLMQSKA